nr:uncharacterized protein LOC109165051 [Ipomoea batatas]
MPGSSSEPTAIFLYTKSGRAQPQPPPHPPPVAPRELYCCISKRDEPSLQQNEGTPNRTAMKQQADNGNNVKDNAGDNFQDGVTVRGGARFAKLEFALPILNAVGDESKAAYKEQCGATWILPMVSPVAFLLKLVAVDFLLSVFCSCNKSVQ